MPDFITGPIIGNQAQQLEFGGLNFPAGEGIDSFETTKDAAKLIQRGIAGFTEDKIEPEALNEKYGIDGELRFQDAIPDSVAAGIRNAKQREIDKRFVAGYSAQDFWSKASRFGAEFVYQALDPINLAANFIPVVGQARYARWLEQAGTAGGRALVRAGVGGAAGAVSQIPFSGLRAYVSDQEQGDYDSADALLDIAFGGAFGGGLHSIGGLIGDKVFGRYAGPNIVQDSLPATRDAALRASVSQLASGRLVDVDPVFAFDPVTGEKFYPTQADAAESLLAQRRLSRQRMEETGDPAILAQDLAERRVALKEELDNYTGTEQAPGRTNLLARVNAVEQQLSNPDLTVPERKALNLRRDELLADVTPEELRFEQQQTQRLRDLTNRIANIDKTLEELTGGEGPSLIEARPEKAIAVKDAVVRSGDELTQSRVLDLAGADATTARLAAQPAEKGIVEQAQADLDETMARLSSDAKAVGVDQKLIDDDLAIHDEAIKEIDGLAKAAKAIPFCDFGGAE